MTVDIKALRELLARATPGPWTCEIDCIDQDDGYVATFCDGATTTLWSAGTDIPLHFAPDGERWTEADSVERNRRYKAAHETQAFREAALIVAAVNALPQLLDMAQGCMNLLARIHRDGGQYTDEHGLAKSLDDADVKVAEMIGEVERLRSALLEACDFAVDNTKWMTLHPTIVRLRTLASGGTGGKP